MRKTSLLKTIAFVLLAGAFMLGARPSEAQVAVNLPDRTARTASTGIIPVTVGDLTGEDVISYEFTITYDESVVNITGASAEGTLSEGATPTVNTSTPGEVRVSYAQTTALSGSGTLINLNASFGDIGSSDLTFADFMFNEGDPAVVLTNGSITLAERAISAPSGFTAFVGQQSVLIPVIVDELTSTDAVISFEFNVTFDPDVLDITDARTDGTLSEDFSVQTNDISDGEIRLAAAGAEAIEGEGTLIYLVATPVASGSSNLELTNVRFNEGTPELAGVPGDITVTPGEAFEATLAPYNEVPPRGSEIEPVSFPAGSASASLSDGTLVFTGSFESLSSTYSASHIHLEETGVNGPVVIPLVATVDADGLGGTWEAEDNTYTPEESLIDALRDGRLYVNVHTANFPGGEIRGQLLDAPNLAPEAVDLVTPVGDTDILIPGNGDVLFSWDASTDPNGDKVVYVGELGIDEDFTIYVDTLVGTSTSFEFSEDELSELLGLLEVPVGETVTLYFRVNAQDGSLRALGATTAVNFTRLFDPEFEGNLSGMNEAPPVSSTGSGTVYASLDGGQLIVAGSFDDLAGELVNIAGTSAHIHAGQVGLDGPVIVPLNVDADDDSRGGVLTAEGNTFILSNVDLPEGWDPEGFAAALADEQLYVNVHTTAYPAGELRAQLKSIPNDAPAAAEITEPAAEANFDVGGDKDAALFTALWTDIGDDSGEHVAYIYQVSTNASFGNVVLSMLVPEPTADVSVRQALEILEENAGDGAGASITVYHRVITTDGSLWTAGGSVPVTLTRSETGQSVSSEDSEMPTEFALEGNYPNPFNPSTTIRFDLPETAEVSVFLVDALGRTVHVTAGQTVQGGANRTLDVDAGALASGTYLYRVVAKGANRTMVEAGTMTLIK